VSYSSGFDRTRAEVRGTREIGELQMDNKTAEFILEATGKLGKAGQFGNGVSQPVAVKSGETTSSKSKASKSLLQKQYVGFGDVMVFLDYDNNQNPIASITDEQGIVLGEVSGVGGIGALKVVVSHLQGF
jgi:hypothetical protein